ncbi:MAG: DUF6492 family protein [Lachnospiraceae bacterium]|nr:DUF6492 family protein [Lachnospiraceae bacterium]
MEQKFDALIVITPADYDRVSRNYNRLVKYLPAERIIFIGSEEVGERVSRDLPAEKTGFLNENDLLPFADVEAVLKERTGADEIPRGMTGWYYQQFLKMTYALRCEDEYYMTWDGDTIPCHNFSMFADDGMPYFDLKQEYQEKYFVTLARLFPGMGKCIPKSFISEHMLFKVDFMRELMAAIENNPALPGERYYEKILRQIDPDQLIYPSFSEFETYGTYICFRHLGSYKMRDWHSFRYCGNFFDPDTITEEDFLWLGKDFEAVSFEKRATRTPESMAIFSKKEYREKLSARQILEIVQEESEGYKEEW